MQLKSLLALPVLLLAISGMSFGNPPGHHIRVKLDNYSGKKLVLGVYFGDKQYVKDTVAIGNDGYFEFNADTLLPCGMYLLVPDSNTQFIQFLVPETDQDFSISVDLKQVIPSLKARGSEDNATFYEYLGFIDKQRTLAEQIKTKIKTHEGDSATLQKKLVEIDRQVKDYQLDLIKKHPGSLCARLVKSTIEPDVPEFEGNPDSVMLRKYFYYHEHFFDNIDLKDGCLIRCPGFFSKADQFVKKFTPQHPDSINRALDRLLQAVPRNSDAYRLFIGHFLDYYAKQEYVSMDAVYVHIALNYICANDPPPYPKATIDKICDDARRLEPILIGKIAPNITVRDSNDAPISLYDIDADYTVLFFWATDCGHCKKAAPFVADFAKKFHNRGVKIIAVCTNTGEKAREECWKGIQEKEFSDVYFINTYDPYLQSRYKTLYDVRTTPKTYILDRQHKIVMKGHKPEEMEKVMEQIMKGN